MEATTFDISPNVALGFSLLILACVSLQHIIVFKKAESYYSYFLPFEMQHLPSIYEIFAIVLQIRSSLTLSLLCFGDSMSNS